MRMRDMYDFKAVYEEYMAVKPSVRETEFIISKEVHTTKEDNSHDDKDG